jgi:beta-glucuronidase
VLRVSPGTRGRLYCGGLGLWARICVDGQTVATTALPYSPLTVELPPAAHAERELLVLVDNRLDPERVPLVHPRFDFHLYGGIYRSIAWHELPPAWIERARVRVLDLATGRIEVEALLGGAIGERVDVFAAIDDGAEEAICDRVLEEGRLRFELTVPDPSPWTPAAPNLHLLRLRLGGDVIEERFGLRTVDVADGCIRSNCERVKRLGDNRHEVHPQYGPALPLAQLVADLELIRDQGCNFVRGAHYAQDQRFLDLCDELGLLVFEESLGWQAGQEQFASRSFAEHAIAQIRAMIRASINHPAVILWGFLNEGESQRPESQPIYEQLAACVRDEDDSRLLTYACNHPHDCRNLDLVDVVTVNTYPGWYARDPDDPRPIDDIEPALRGIMVALAGRGQGDKPFLIGEIGAGAIYGWRDPHAGFWSEQYQADYLAEVCRVVAAEPRIAGCALWQFCDGRTYGGSRSLGRPRGFNNKGSFDEYRRPKLGAEAVRAAWRRGVAAADPIPAFAR